MSETFAEQRRAAADLGDRVLGMMLLMATERGNLYHLLILTAREN